ncbi:hypothetical protein BAC3_01615 [uncultured bacterium]|nr:hypothetical protein BAC3_01615 [uncultured bacterium]
MLTPDEMRQSLNKPQVGYQEFMLHVGQNKNGLFCFFEGKDAPYYIPRIKQFTQNYHSIKCGGKDKVLSVHRLISKHTEYQKYKKAFFVDRDFDEPVNNPDIFETPCYSIENLYTSIAVFKEIIKNSLGLSEIRKSYQTCMSLYTERQKEFHQAVILFNAWYACLIAIRNTTKKETGVNLSDRLGGDKTTKDFITFSLESISKNYNFQLIKQKFPNALEVSGDALNQKIVEFSNCEPHKVFRGKYEMQFVITIIDLILQDSNKQQRYIKEKIKFSFSSNLSNQQAIELFSSYAETPDSLNKYLQQITSE